MKAASSAALAVLLAATACERAADPAPPANGAAAPGKAAVQAPLAAQYEPWGEASCGMVLKGKPDGAHVAWIGGSDYGVLLGAHVEAIRTLPHASDLGLRLRADGDPKREVAAKGQRGDSESDSANYIEVILDKPQRDLIDGAERIAVVRADKVLVELPVDTLADLESVAEACTPGGPGQYPEE